MCGSVRVYAAPESCNAGHTLVLSATNERELSDVIRRSSARFTSKRARHYPNVSMSTFCICIHLLRDSTLVVNISCQHIHAIWKEC